MINRNKVIYKNKYYLTACTNLGIGLTLCDILIMKTDNIIPIVTNRIITQKNKPEIKINDQLDDTMQNKYRLEYIEILVT